MLLKEGVGSSLKDVSSCFSGKPKRMSGRCTRKDGQANTPTPCERHPSALPPSPPASGSAHSSSRVMSALLPTRNHTTKGARVFHSGKPLPLKRTYWVNCPHGGDSNATQRGNSSKAGFLSRKNANAASSSRPPFSVVPILSPEHSTTSSLRDTKVLPLHELDSVSPALRGGLILSG